MYYPGGKSPGPMDVGAAAARPRIPIRLEADERRGAANHQAQGQKEQSAEPVGGALELVEVCERHSPSPF